MRLALFLILLGSLFSCKITNQFDQSNSDLPKHLSNYIHNEFIFNQKWLSGNMDEDAFEYKPILSKPYWVIPSKKVSDIIEINKSNNNVSIAIYEKRIYLAFRTGPTHFASKKTGLYVISSNDAVNWKKELSVFVKRDVREPFLIPINNELHFYFFSAGTKITAFNPEKIYHYKLKKEVWSGPDEILSPGEIHWSIKNRKGRTYMTSYIGNHYKLNGQSQVALHFKSTLDGINFTPNNDSSLVYLGGVSECAFEFDYEGNLWGVTRLEDGDKTGFGSHVIYADKENLHKWYFPKKSDSKCFMSPRMFNHNNQLYLIARKHLGNKPFQRANRNLPLFIQRLSNWMTYSFTKKTTALYRINKIKKKVEWVLDLPGDGDTAFPSIVQLDKNTFLYANYSSPINPDRKKSWIIGQLSKTGIYFQLIKFIPR